MDKEPDLVTCMAGICARPGNPVAWLILEEAGLTREGIKAAAEGDGWFGPQPDWDSYPSEEIRKAYFARKEQAK